MIIKLNLLEPGEKKIIAKDTRYISWINSLVFFSLAVVLASVALYAGAKCIEIKMAKLGQIDITSGLDREVIDINAEMNEAKQVQNGYIKWSRVLSNTILTIPEGNLISSLKFDKKNSRIDISGMANERDDFLKLKQAWENSDFVSNLESPISNLLYQHDVDFNLSGELNL